MSITPQDIFNIAPELASKPSAQVQTAINHSSLLINVKKFGDKADMAHAYLAAFLLSFFGGSMGGGQLGITMEKTGDLQRSYGLLLNGNVLNQNVYGSIFQMILKTLVFTPIVTGQKNE